MPSPSKTYIVEIYLDKDRKRKLTFKKFPKYKEAAKFAREIEKLGFEWKLISD